MRPLFAALTVGLAASAAAADDPPARKAEPTLKVGDKAPALKADKWVNGPAIEGFEPGRVYVVEFWATWCGPCVAMMPHLADLAEEYKARGVSVVGFNSRAKDQEDKNDRFAERRAAKLGYTFAWADDSETDTNWMRAAGRGGIPCSFVVDKGGRLAYIGHPMYLDAVLPKVVAGTWDIEAGAAEVKALEAEWAKARTALSGDPAEGLKTFAAVRPEVANIPYLLGPRLEALVKAKRYVEAEALAAGVIAKAARRGDSSGPTTVANSLAQVDGQPGLAALAVRAADAGLAAAGDDDQSALLAARAAYAAAGQADKAKGFADKAIALEEKKIKGDGGPGDLNGYFVLIMVAKAAKDEAKVKEAYQKARPVLEKRLKGEDDWQGHLGLARLAAAAGDTETARAAGRKALDKAPKGMREAIVQTLKPHGIELKADDK